MKIKLTHISKYNKGLHSRSRNLLLKCHGKNKKKKKGTNIEYKTDQRKPQIDEKPMENNITPPTNQRA